MAIDGKQALALLDQIGNQNANGEYYLTDVVEIANGAGLNVAATEASFESVLGINNRAELAEAETIWQQRKRRADHAVRRHPASAGNGIFLTRHRDW